MNKLNNFVDIENSGSLVNLKNVTNVAFLNTNRIVFNFNSNIDSKTRNGVQIIADYRYDNYSDAESYAVKCSELSEQLLNFGFIRPVFQKHGHHWVNPDHITFINVDYKRQRLIFNLANSVTKPVNGELMLVNDFVFWTHDNEAELEESIKHVFDLIK